MKVILFDLGNTLIRVDPFEKGPMVNWANLALNENSIPETLEQLASDYSLYIATNAQDSNYEQMLEVLKRVGICSYFNDVFMKQTVGVEKSTPEYYQRILEKTKCSKDQVLMVGDDYLRDVLIPHSIGIQTCFYNPALKNEINSVSPIQNIECFQLKNLQGKLKKMLPSIETCFNWLIENGASHKLLMHVQTVAAISYDLSLRIAMHGHKIDPILAHRGGLLHDLDKLHPDSSRYMHGKIGAKLLRERGYPALAEIARRHTPAWQDEESIPITWEQKLVFYADKLVKGSQVVSLSERFADLKVRYPMSREIYRLNAPKIRALEEEIMNVIDCSAEGYLDIIKRKLLTGSTQPPNKSN